MENIIKKWKTKLNKLQIGAVFYTQDEKEVPKELIERISLVSEMVEDLEELQSV